MRCFLLQFSIDSLELHKNLLCIGKSVASLIYLPCYTTQMRVRSTSQPDFPATEANIYSKKPQYHIDGVCTHKLWESVFEQNAKTSSDNWRDVFLSIRRMCSAAHVKAPSLPTLLSNVSFSCSRTFSVEKPSILGRDSLHIYKSSPTLCCSDGSDIASCMKMVLWQYLLNILCFDKSQCERNFALIDLKPQKYFDWILWA